MSVHYDDNVDNLAIRIADPKWDHAGRVHDWRNYVSDEVQGMWNTFTFEQQAALYRQADDEASKEEWD